MGYQDIILKKESRDIEYKEILVKKENHIAIVTINRPPMNPIGVRCLLELDAAFRDIKYDNGIRVSIITGAGDRAFCAGADVKEWSASDFGKRPEEIKALDEAMRRPMVFPRHAEESSAIFLTGKPSIAMVNGVAVGVGADWVATADLAIASERARIGWVYILRGLYPVEGGTWLLPRIVGLRKAMELLLTGDIIDAEEALGLGIFNKVVPHDQLMDATMKLANKIANKTSPSAVAVTRHLVYTGLGQSFRDHLDSMEAAGRAVSEEHRKEAMLAWVEKREPVFKD